jgi:hypothetical protein
MKSLVSFIVSLGFCFVLLIGCIKYFDIIVIDSGDKIPSFRFKSSGIISTRGVEIDNFYIYLFNENSESFVWRIESIDSKQHFVEEIKYGIVPDGFSEIIKPITLISGSNYVAGSRMPGKVGWVDFVLK